MEIKKKTFLKERISLYMYSQTKKRKHQIIITATTTPKGYRQTSNCHIRITDFILVTETREELELISEKGTVKPFLSHGAENFHEVGIY